MRRSGVSGVSGGGFGSGRVSGQSRAAGPVLGDSRRHVQTVQVAECLRVRGASFPRDPAICRLERQSIRA